MSVINKEIVIAYRSGGHYDHFRNFRPRPDDAFGCFEAEEIFEQVLKGGKLIRGTGTLVDPAHEEYPVAQIVRARVVSPAHQWSDEEILFSDQNVYCKNPFPERRPDYTDSPPLNAGKRSGLVEINGVIFIARRQDEGEFLIQRPVTKEYEKKLKALMRSKFR